MPFKPEASAFKTQVAILLRYSGLPDPHEVAGVLDEPSKHMSVAEAQKALQVQDKILMSFPEIDRVFGKAGHRDHAHHFDAALCLVTGAHASDDTPGSPRLLLAG